MPSDEENRRILDLYVPVARGIAATFGSKCEVIIHDLSMPKTSIRHIFNSEVSGRKVGDGTRDLISDVLRSPNFNNDMLPNYEFNISRKKCKSTTIIIRNLERQVIGALCINFDLTELQNAQDFLANFMNMDRRLPVPEEEVEVKDQDVLNILEYIIDQSIAEVSGGSSRLLSREEMIEVVRFLDQKGAFLIKGAVEWLATKLGISRFTVYSYIKESKVEVKK